MSKTNSRKKNKIISLGVGIKADDFLNNHKKLIKFNFKHYSHAENQGQDFKCWSKEDILVSLNEKFVSISSNSKEYLIQNEIIELYDRYPKDSKFECPKSLIDADISWARIRLTGRRRLIGFFLNNKEENDNTFYVVFLDKDHEFAPYTKK